MMRRPKTRKGSLLVMSLGVMVLVSFLTVNQLDSIKMNFSIRKHMDHQRAADIAARSGLDYGYAMIKNVMESMSLVELRFATHIYNSQNPGMVAEVPPSWQEIINNQFDADAREAFSDGRGFNWVGTDGFDAGDNVDPNVPFDYNHAGIYHQTDEAITGLHSSVLGPSGSKSLQATDPYESDVIGEDLIMREYGFGSQLPAPDQAKSTDKSTLSECAVEGVYRTGTVTRELYTLAPDHLYSQTECDLFTVHKGDSAAENVFSDQPSIFEEREYNFMTDGHFGTKRWHYYDSWNFSALGGDDVLSDVDSANPRGTGGMIRRNPPDLDGGSTYFSDHSHILWERLFNHRRDTSMRYPYEPLDPDATTPEERDVNNGTYLVELFTEMNLDGLDPASGEVSDIALMDPNNYGNMKHKIFFKLWVTRDEGRDNYGRTGVPGTVVTTALIEDEGGSAIDLMDWSGNTLSSLVSGGNPLEITTSDYAVDLHPIWSLRRDSADQVYSRANNGDVTLTQADETSLGRPFYLQDFLDWDGDNDTAHRLGALSFPVPYLAYQRGDFDYFHPSVRGTNQSTPVSLAHPHYTKFTLWSLGTVREVDPLLDGANAEVVEEDEQLLTHFRIVARALYKMDFYMDTRVVDVNDDTSYEFDSGFDDEATGGCDTTTRQNMANQIYFNARRIPVCDLEDGVVLIHEPMGIYIDNFEKVNYRSSIAP